MTFWLLTLAMVAIAIMCVLWPLSRRSQASIEDEATEDRDLALFKMQLSDVETRLKSPDLTDAERETAEAERAEIARRILRADKLKRSAADQKNAAPWLAGRRYGALATLALVPLVTAVTYAAIGSPGLKDEPLSARVAPELENRSIDEMLAMAERHLASNPDDLKGWTVLLGTYKRMGRAPDAARAAQQIIRLDGRKPNHLADLAEALTVANGNVVPERANQLFNEALAAEPNMPKATFYAALALEQEDKKAEALVLWQKAVKLRQNDQRWQAAVRARIAALDPKALQEGFKPIPSAEGPVRGPTTDDVDAAASLTAAQRSQMINGMVTSLAQRLAETPNDLPGWQQLIRSYTVLQRLDDAKQALQKARKVFAANSEAMKQLASLETSLNLQETKTQ
ncbi:MAG: c-type cytochrome biogenesis protein CcmI [Pseudomonadota bacterium]